MNRPASSQSEKAPQAAHRFDGVLFYGGNISKFSRIDDGGRAIVSPLISG